MGRGRVGSTSSTVSNSDLEHIAACGRSTRSYFKYLQVITGIMMGIVAISLFTNLHNGNSINTQAYLLGGGAGSITLLALGRIYYTRQIRAAESKKSLA